MLLKSTYLSTSSKNEFSVTELPSFPELLKSSTNDEFYDTVFNDIETLFTGIPVQETTDYILQRIYVCKEIKLFVKNQNSKSCY